MKISKGTRIKDQADYNGYGYATKNMYESLSRLGYEWSENDESADVEIWFDQPHHWKWSKGVYRIGYHPWESTALLPPGKMTDNKDWFKAMNEVDEIWTPSPLIADWYRNYMDIRPPVYVYEHGVDPIWTPKRRAVDGTFRFLHVGAEAARKGALEAMKALRLAFPRETDVRLTLKMMTSGWKIGRLPRIDIVNRHLSLTDLIQMYHDHHVFVYPSYGEGFGLNPLQAMSTGMPTITVPRWAPYAQYLDKRLNIDSAMIKSPWPGLHPGNMLKPNLDDVIDAMRFAYENYDEIECFAHQRTLEIAEHYSWDRLTRETFEALEKRIGS